MDLFAALVAIGRRWYLSLFLLALVVAGTLVAVGSVKPQYKADSAGILLAPTQPAVKTGENAPTNPYLENGIATFASALANVMATDGTKQQVIAQGGSPNYTVVPGATNTTSTIMGVEGTANTAAQAAKTVEVLNTLLEHQVTALQTSAGVDPRVFITLKTLSSGNTPSALRGSRVRVGVAVGGVGIVVMLIVVLVVDDRLVRRRRRRSRRRSSTTSTETKSGDSDAPDRDLAIAPAVGDREA